MKNKARSSLIMIRLSVQFFIAAILSVVITLINYGYTNHFFQNWIKGFIIAFVIIPFAIKLIPIVAKFSISHIGNRSPIVIKCVVAILVAMTMEGIISFAITMIQNGFSPDWFIVWILTFIKALPAGFLIGFVMTFIVQPYMQRLTVSSMTK